MLPSKLYVFPYQTYKENCIKLLTNQINNIDINNFFYSIPVQVGNRYEKENYTFICHNFFPIFYYIIFQKKYYL